jgi:hypothetical protein
MDDNLIENVDTNIFDFDLNLLDVECRCQPKLYFKYAEQYEEVLRKLDNAERILKAIDAKLDDRIRAKEKLTETAIKNKILLHEKHEIQAEKVSRYTYKAGILRQILVSLEHRKRMIEKAVDLHGQKYFATPKISDRSEDIKNKIEQRAFIVKQRKKKE